METTRLTNGPSRWDGRSYAYNLPSTPAGSTLHGPPYLGTPGTTLSLTMIDPNKMQRAVWDGSDTLISIEEFYSVLVLCPTAKVRFYVWSGPEHGEYETYARCSKPRVPGSYSLLLVN